MIVKIKCGLSRIAFEPGDMEAELEQHVYCNDVLQSECVRNRHPQPVSQRELRQQQRDRGGGSTRILGRTHEYGRGNILGWSGGY